MRQKAGIFVLHLHPSHLRNPPAKVTQYFGRAGAEASLVAKALGARPHRGHRSQSFRHLPRPSVGLQRSRSLRLFCAKPVSWRWLVVVPALNRETGTRFNGTRDMMGHDGTLRF